MTLGFYNKNKKLNQKVQKYKEKNKRLEENLLKLNLWKTNNESLITNNMKILQRKKEKFNLLKKTLNECMFNFTEIQRLQTQKAQSISNRIDMINIINSFPKEILINDYKPISPKM